MDDRQFENWIKGFQADFTLRQKEVIAKLAWARCRGVYKGQKVMKIQIRREDIKDAV